MKAMILAAGLGTRLRPLTNDRPKALVELNGTSLLEHNLKRLASFGIQEFFINVHHFADKVEDYLKMIEYKTAVLVGASLQMGAIVSGADDESQKYIYNFGMNLGDSRGTL